MDGLRKLALADLLRSLAADGTAVGLVTHDADFAAEACDLVTTIARGRVLADAAPAGVLSEGAFFVSQVGSPPAGANIKAAAWLHATAGSACMPSLCCCSPSAASSRPSRPSSGPQPQPGAGADRRAGGGGGRRTVLFAFIPNVQPVTVTAAVTGATLGPRAGWLSAVRRRCSSNAFLGQGPWTPWQMIGWGLVGATAGAMPVLRNRWALAAFGLAWGFLFDWLMDVWAWSALGPSADGSSFVSSSSPACRSTSPTPPETRHRPDRGAHPDPHGRPLRAAAARIFEPLEAPT